MWSEAKMLDKSLTRRVYFNVSAFWCMEYINLLKMKINKNSIPKIYEIIENINGSFIKRNNN